MTSALGSTLWTAAVTGVRDLAGPLEGHVARQADGKIGKIAVARSTDADPILFEQAHRTFELCQNILFRMPEGAASNKASMVFAGPNRPLT